MEAAAPPVELGEPTSGDPLVAQLHRAVLADQPRRVRRCLARGCRPDAVNAAGQTPLFCAALAGRPAAAAELLRRGADPNTRCDGGYTAVHGACHAGRLRVLRRLLECGGDLRLYDLAGRRPADWARLQPDPLRRRRVLQLLEAARLAALTSNGRELLVERSTSFSAGGGGVRTLLRRLLPRETPRRATATAADEVDMADLTRSVQSVGYGDVYYGGGESSPGVLAVLPLVTERALEPDHSARGYPLGAFTEMTPRLYAGEPVSVRRLVERPPAGTQRDLLIAELTAARRLRHPSLLLLMAVCPSENLDAVTLVFERVSLGSLHHCLYGRGLRLAPAAAAELLLQVCAALRFMHRLGWLHCAVTSHAVQLLSTTQAKLGCLEHALVVSAEPPRPQRRLLACRAEGDLFNWLAPEVLRDGVPTELADTYSFCALTWELMHGQVPWDGLSCEELSAQAKTGRISLAVRPELCPVILRDVLDLGLRADPLKRDLQLDEVKFMLTNLRDGVQRGRSRPAAVPAAQTPLARPATPSSRPVTPTSRPATPASRPTTPAGRPGTPASVGRRLKPPAPAPPRHTPPARLSRTLSPDALRPPPGRESTPQRQTRTLDDPHTAEATDPYTGLRRTATPRLHTRSSTYQISPSGSWQEATAIKPASHRLTRHGSSCSLSRRQAAGATESGASPWPPVEWEGEAAPGRHSVSLNSQAPRPPRFSPSPPSVRGLGLLRAELDPGPLFPPLPGTDGRTAAAARSQTPAAAIVQSTSPVSGPRPAASRPLRPSSVRSSGADRGTRSLPWPAPLISDPRGVARARPGPGPGQTPAAMAPGRWRRREIEVQASAAVADTASQTASGEQTSGVGAAESSGRPGQSSSGPAVNSSTNSSGNTGRLQSSGSSSGPAPQSSSYGPAQTSTEPVHSSTEPVHSSSNGPAQISTEPARSSTEPARGSSNGPTQTSSTEAVHGSREPVHGSRPANGSSGSGPSRANGSRAGASQTSTEPPVQSSAVQTATISSDEQVVSSIKQSFAARREFFSSRCGGGGRGGHSQSDSALRLPRGVKLNPALLLRRDPEPARDATASSSPPAKTSSPSTSRAVLLGQPRPFQRPMGAATVSHVPSTSPAAEPAPSAVTSTPHRPATARPEPPAISSLSSGTPGSGAAGQRVNVTFRPEVLEFSASTPPDETPASPPDSPASDDGRDYYDDDLASPATPPPHLQLLEPELPDLPPSPPLQPPPYAACLDDGGRASPLSMELPSSAAGSELGDLPTLGLDDGRLSCEEGELGDRAELRELQDELSQPLTPLHVSESGDSDGEELDKETAPFSSDRGGRGGRAVSSPCITSSETTLSDGSRLRLLEVSCERGYQTHVETRARQDGQCTVVCTNTNLADGTTETYRQTVSADQVQTQIVVADR